MILNEIPYTLKENLIKKKIIFCCSKHIDRIPRTLTKISSFLHDTGLMTKLKISKQHQDIWLYHR